MTASRLRPVAEDPGEVVDVVGEEHAAELLRSGEEHRVVELLQVVDGPCGEDVDAAAPERTNKAAAGQVGVEEQKDRITVAQRRPRPRRPG